MKDVQLRDIDAQMTDVNLKLQATLSEQAGISYDELELELFFDEDGVITLEMHDLVLVGTGMIKDAESGNIEAIEFKGPLNTGNILIKPEEVMAENGNIYPKFTVTEVNLILDEQNTVVNAHGKTPLFKSQKFTTSISKWLHSSMKSLTNQM